MPQSRQIILKSRPDGTPTPANFDLQTTTIGSPADGQVLVRNLFMSVDPYMRGRMRDVTSYIPPFQVGQPLDGGAVGEVVESRNAKFAVGDKVSSNSGWREYFLSDGNGLTKIPEGLDVPLSAFLGVLGMPGLTGWSGLTQIGKPKAGDTVFVSGAAGAVGSVVAQVAKILGCTVIASAGSDEKCAWLKAAGIDHVINYHKESNLLAAVRAAAPKGIDVYFDNVGGAHLEVAIEVARMHARLVECGMISTYNATGPTPGPRNIIMVVGKSLLMRGFIVIEFQHLQDEFLRQMGGWVQGGRLKWQETVVDGIAAAPDAFIGLFSGKNKGKMIVKL